MADDGEHIELKSRQEILDETGDRDVHSGNQTQLQQATNELMKAQIHQQQRVEREMNDLKSSLDSYKRWSRGLTIALVILSAGLLIVQLVQMGYI